MANEVWIFPTYFFELVSGLRTQTALPAGSAPIGVPDISDDAGSSYLRALSTAVDDVRTMMAANFEIGGRALVLAGTRVVDADMVESGFTTADQFYAPYTTGFGTDDPGSDPKYGQALESGTTDEYYEQGEKYLEDAHEFVAETERIREGG